MSNLTAVHIKRYVATIMFKAGATLAARHSARRLAAGRSLPRRSAAFASSSAAAASTGDELPATFSSMAVAAALLLATSGAYVQSNVPNLDESKAIGLDEQEDENEMHTILNWSGTHQVDLPVSSYHEPESTEELEALVKKCHETGTPLRPIGSALSPNGIGFRSTGMVNLVNLDEIIHVDEKKMTVTVQAGSRVGQVVDELRKHGLTLPNLASIAEQQMGGFISVGAHGTGAKITPVDDFVTSLKMVTPAHGTITLSPKDGERFQMAKVGLGCLGVVSEVTMRCIPAHNLVEHTYVLSRAEARKQLDTLLKKHKHMRYMWIPYEDAVVVVTNDPEYQVPKEAEMKENSSNLTEEERFRPLTDLLIDLAGNNHETYTPETIMGMGFGELRDALLSFAPLDKDHVKRVNKVEAEFWRRSEGWQTKPSDK